MSLTYVHSARGFALSIPSMSGRAGADGFFRFGLCTASLRLLSSELKLTPCPARDLALARVTRTGGSALGSCLSAAAPAAAAPDDRLPRPLEGALGLKGCPSTCAQDIATNAAALSTSAPHRDERTLYEQDVELGVRDASHMWYMKVLS